MTTNDSTPAPDLADISSALDGVNVSADRVSKTLTRTFANAVVAGRSFQDTLKSIALNLSQLALNAGLQPLASGLGGLLTSGLGSALTSLMGGGGTIAPFADGGVVAQPTFFGSAGGPGLMGEKGAEAIIPLSRGPDGRLGIAANGHGARNVAVNVTISTPDAESFRRSQVQISGALARAVARGQRAL